MIMNDNPRPNTIKIYITDLTLLARYYEHKKSFRQLTREEILTYLQSHRKTSAADANECWINSYNRKTISAIKFFEWLYLLDMERQQRKKAKVDIVRDLPLYKRKEKTSVEATDLWLPVEDAVILKYCPDVRLCLYHTMSDDTSGRPHELLSKRFGDVKIKNHNGRTYGEVGIGRGNFLPERSDLFIFRRSCAPPLSS